MYIAEEKIKSLKITRLGKAICYIVTKLIKHDQSIKNIQYIFNNMLTDPQKKRLLQSFYTHLLTSLKELIIIRLIGYKKLTNKVEVIGEKYFFDALKKGKGVIFISGHLGSFEFALPIGLQKIRKFQGTFYVIRKGLPIKAIEKCLFKNYRNANLGIIKRRNALFRSIKALKKNDAVFFIIDRKVKEKNRHSLGTMVSFLGKKTCVYNTTAYVAKKTGAIVIPATSYRQGSKHFIEFFEPIPWKYSKDIKKEIELNTQQYLSSIEKMLLKNPEQWLWSYNFWRI